MKLILICLAFFSFSLNEPPNCIPLSHHDDWKTTTIKEKAFKMQLPPAYSGGMKTEEGEKIFSVSTADHAISFTQPMGKLNSYSSGNLPANLPDTIYIHFGGPMGREAMLSNQIKFCDQKNAVVGVFYYTVDSQFGRLFWLNKDQFEPVLDANFDQSSLQEITTVFATVTKC